MSKIDEYVKKLEESIAEVEPFSPQGGDRIREIIDLVKNLSKGDNKKKALEIVNETLERMIEYESYVPVSITNFKFLKAELSK